MNKTLRRIAVGAAIAAPLLMLAPTAASTAPRDRNLPVSSNAPHTTLTVEGNLVTATVSNIHDAPLNCTAVLQYNGTPLTQLSWQLFQLIQPGTAAVYEMDAPLPGKYRERTVCYEAGAGPTPGEPIPSEFLAAIMSEGASLIGSSEQVVVTLPHFFGMK
jgi:hypothetical protein